MGLELPLFLRLVSQVNCHGKEKNENEEQEGDGVDEVVVQGCHAGHFERKGGEKDQVGQQEDPTPGFFPDDAENENAKVHQVDQDLEKVVGPRTCPDDAMSVQHDLCYNKRQDYRSDQSLFRNGKVGEEEQPDKEVGCAVQKDIEELFDPKAPGGKVHRVHQGEEAVDQPGWQNDQRKIDVGLEPATAGKQGDPDQESREAYPEVQQVADEVFVQGRPQGGAVGEGGIDVIVTDGEFAEIGIPDRQYMGSRGGILPVDQKGEVDGSFNLRGFILANLSVLCQQPSVPPYLASRLQVDHAEKYGTRVVWKGEMDSQPFHTDRISGDGPVPHLAPGGIVIPGITVLWIISGHEFPGTQDPLVFW